MLDSDELLVGKWDVSIRCDPRWFQSELFPPKMSVAASEFADENDQRPKRRLFPSRRSHPCQLKVFSNGTFCLSPKQDEHDRHHQANNCARRSLPADRNDSYLAVRGRWKVHANPYCVTDRFFDEITLTSYKRVQKIVLDPNSSSETTAGSSKVLKQGSFQMKCRLTGHFTPGRLARRLRRNHFGWYGKGSLSRGLLLWEQQQTTSPCDKDHTTRRNTPLSLRASFSGKRWVPPLSIIHSRDDDEEEDFQYEN